MRIVLSIVMLFISINIFAAKKKVVLFPLQGGGCSREVIMNAEKKLKNELYRYNYSVVKKQNLNSYYKKQSIKNCNGKSCAKRTVISLKADLGIFGRLFKEKRSLYKGDYVYKLDLYVVIKKPWKFENDFYRISEDKGRYIFQIKNLVVNELNNQYVNSQIQKGIALQNLEIAPSVLFPSNTIKYVNNAGVGIDIKADLYKVPVFDSFYFGAGTGLFYLGGDKENIDYMYMFPLFLTASLNLELFNNFFCKPTIGMGSMLSLLNRNVNQYVNEAYEYKNEFNINPMAHISLSVEYGFQSGLNLFVKSSYMLLFDKEHYGQYMTLSIGGSLLF